MLNTYMYFFFYVTSVTILVLKALMRVMAELMHCYFTKATNLLYPGHTGTCQNLEPK